MKAVKAVELDGDWSIIPNELYEEFTEDSNNEELWESGGFDDKWYEYKTSGDLNLVQLYTFDMITKLREHLDSVTPEQFQKEIEEIEIELGIPSESNHTNLTLDFKVTSTSCEMEDCPHCAYEEQQEYEVELEKDACIDFAKWLAKEWMSIWVVDKWLWEWQPERTPETIHMHLKYYTEEELYELYLKEN